MEKATEVFRPPDGKALRVNLGFEASKLYFLRVDGQVFYTKPIVEAAY